MNTILKKVMKVLKGKYEAEINARKEIESQKQQGDSLLEKLETDNRNLRSQSKQFEQDYGRDQGGELEKELNALLRLENEKL